MNKRRAVQLTNRFRRLPEQLDAARRKVAMLEREAARYGMHELVQQENSSVDQLQSDA